MKTIVITGASDGIGLSAARILNSKGHKIIIVGRNKEKTERAAKELGCEYFTCDFAKLSEIKDLAAKLNKLDRIDVLANNAGAINNKRTVTEDGFEKTFQVNVIGQFVLTNLLIDKLIESRATVIQTSSIAAKVMTKGINLDDLQHEKEYSAVSAYADSKLCNYLFTKELDRRYKDQGINSVAFQPGVPRTNFAIEGPKFFNFMYHSIFKYLFSISPKRAAKRLIRLCEGEPNKDFKTGVCYSNKRLYKIRYDKDGSISKQLWECLSTLTRIK